MKSFSALCLGVLFLLSCAGCAGSPAAASKSTAMEEVVSSAASSIETGKALLPPDTVTIETGLFERQLFAGANGDIHYSYYLPPEYDGVQKLPLVMVMPGYDGMWFGEERSRRPSEWNGFTAWTKLDTPLIVVSAQLTDWGEKSARQAIELTEYFMKNCAVDESRVYAAGYSAGGETMSQAVSMRPELYEAYLHGASQWDGSYDPVAQSGMAVYLYMAESDEYYGSDKARAAYENLYAAYQNAGWSEDEIHTLLRLEIPPDSFFNEKGIYNYHGGANVLFDDAENLNWILTHKKGQETG